MACTDPKDALRAALTASRAAVPHSEREARDRARTALAVRALPDEAAVVAAYCSLPDEPGTEALIDWLTASGRRVLLPVLSRRPAWAWFTTWAATPPGPLGIRRPNGPSLGPDALAAADLVIAPCLAVSRTGVRLGTGGGWYDRALPYRRPGTPVWAFASADEVLAELPRQPHDVLVDAVVTELGVLSLATR